MCSCVVCWWKLAIEMKYIYIQYYERRWEMKSSNSCVAVRLSLFIGVEIMNFSVLFQFHVLWISLCPFYNFFFFAPSLPFSLPMTNIMNFISISIFVWYEIFSIFYPHSLGNKWISINCNFVFFWISFSLIHLYFFCVLIPMTYGCTRHKNFNLKKKLLA